MSEALPIGAQFRARREGLGLSQQELATRAGVSRPTIWALETKNSTTTRGLVQRVADVLGCDYVEELVPRHRAVPVDEPANKLIVSVRS